MARVLLVFLDSVGGTEIILVVPSQVTSISSSPNSLRLFVEFQLYPMGERPLRALMFIRDGVYIYGWKGVPIRLFVVLLVLRIGSLLPKRCYDMLGMSKVWDGKRGKIEIIAEILRQLRVPTVRTNIMSHCNMSSAQSGQYLTFMRSSDLIQMDAIRGMVTYQRTQAGREFLDLYNKMVLLLDPSVYAPSLF